MLVTVINVISRLSFANIPTYLNNHFTDILSVYFVRVIFLVFVIQDFTEIKLQITLDWFRALSVGEVLVLKLQNWHAHTNDTCARLCVERPYVFCKYFCVS